MGNGEYRPAGTDRHQAPLGTIIAQTHGGRGMLEAGPITYCLSQGPQLGKVPPKATLNGWDQNALEAYLTGAHFDVSHPVVQQASDPTIPSGKIIDVFNATNNNQIIDGQQVDVSTVQIGWTVSTGKATIQLSASNLVGQPYGSVVQQIRDQHFTNVSSAPDNTAGTQQPGNVTRISRPDGPYTADTPIVVYYAPQPVAPTTPSSSQSQNCDPNQDPTCQQGGPFTTPFATG